MDSDSTDRADLQPKCVGIALSHHITETKFLNLRQENNLNVMKRKQTFINSTWSEMLVPN